MLRLGDWLASQGVTIVAMESTGVYWKPVWNLLEDRFELMLVNAQHIKQVPGRKTDVQGLRSGSPSCCSTACSRPASCRPGPSASCAT